MSRINLAVSAFEICVGHQPGPAVSRSGDVDDVQIVLLDQAIEMDVNEIQSRRRAPMAEQSWLDMFEFQRLAQQRIRRR